MDESHLIAVPPSPRVCSLIQTGSGSKSESSATSFILILSSQVSDVTSTAADVAFAVLALEKAQGEEGASERIRPLGILGIVSNHLVKELVSLSSLSGSHFVDGSLEIIVVLYPFS